MTISMFNRPKPKQFNLKTRYYDAEKEALEKRKAERKAKLSADSLRNEMDKKWHRDSKKKSTRLTLLYISALIAFLYFIFFR